MSFSVTQSKKRLRAMEFLEEFSKDEQSRIIGDFRRLDGVHYLDTAGAGLYAESQINLIASLLTGNLFCNPHTSRNTENIVDNCRYQILKHFNTNSDEYSVIFTAGATTSLKIVGETFKFNNEGSFYYLTDSHTSVLGMREIVNTPSIIPILKDKFLEKDFGIAGSGLITFPAQCNFNGFKYPLQIIEKLHENPEVFVCLDAALFVSTNFLDLSRYRADYVCLSFYKIFGYPTGLGALLVSKRGAEKLVKKYYGGGTVKIALTRTNWHQKRDLLHAQFEDGTINYLSVVALQSCFQFMKNLLGDDFIHRISRHVFNLGQYLYRQLESLKHFNNQPLVTFHQYTRFDDRDSQGGIVNFSLRHADGSFVGFAEFASIAALHNIILRTGCFCNPGSCQTHLGLSNEDLMKQFNAGHVCGDDNDLIDGAPTGSIRASFGYMTTKENIDKLVQVIRKCYLETSQRISPPREDQAVIKSKPRLKSIRIYPIKSCAPMIIDGSWNVTNRGLKFDREWLIINGSNGTAMTQKNDTRMCLIKPFIDEAKKTMRLDFPQMPSIEFPLIALNGSKRNAKLCETKVCGDRIQGFDCGNEVAEWLSEALATEDLRLIRQTDEVERKNGVRSLSNQAQFLLISEPSVEWLINQVEEWDDSVQDVENIVDRFRGNLIIDNLEPLSETSFKKMSIAGISFEVQGPCTRCQMICIDQSTSEKTTEPLRTIGKVFKGKMRFGIYLRHIDGDDSTLNCGDELDQ